jgi:membrane protein implicated in regulation of membrane protease activity
MCEGCIHPVVAFSWLGGILINSSVVALISWSALASWPIGFALAALYAIVSTQRLEPGSSGTMLI